MTARIEQLVRDFAEGVLAQTAAMKVDDPTTANKHAKRYIAAFGPPRDGRP